MKNNKKGFTLIELLAVIVILAVIALIAVPQVLKILNQARKSAAEDSAYGILKSAESYVATYMMNNHGDWNGTMYFKCDGSKCVEAEKGDGAEDASATYTAKTGASDPLDFKGSKPKDGVIILNSYGEASIVVPLKIGSFTCSQAGDTVECSNS